MYDLMVDTINYQYMKSFGPVIIVVPTRFIHSDILNTLPVSLCSLNSHVVQIIMLKIVPLLLKSVQQTQLQIHAQPLDFTQPVCC